MKRQQRRRPPFPRPRTGSRMGSIDRAKPGSCSGANARASPRIGRSDVRSLEERCDRPSVAPPAIRAASISGVRIEMGFESTHGVATPRKIGLDAIDAGSVDRECHRELSLDRVAPPETRAGRGVVPEGIEPPTRRVGAPARRADLARPEERSPPPSCATKENPRGSARDGIATTLSSRAERRHDRVPCGAWAGFGDDGSA
jgi:hypothetical protein